MPPGAGEEGARALDMALLVMAHSASLLAVAGEMNATDPRVRTHNQTMTSSARRMADWNRQGDHALSQTTGAGRLSLPASEDGCDPIEDRLRATIPTTIEAVADAELTTPWGLSSTSAYKMP